MNGCRARLILLILSLCAFSTALAATHIVEQDGSGDFTTITAAVAVAAADDLILVGGGIYTEQMIVIDRVLHIMASGGPETTTIDGESLDGILDYVAGGGGTLSGFTLANANSLEGGGAVDMNTAGGHLDIRNCQFMNNVADYQGGGIAAGGASSAYVADCLFQGNFAPVHCGAAVGIESSQLEFVRCEFRENSTNTFSGALAVHSSLLEVTDCLFVGNESGDVSGAIYYYSSIGTVENNTFVDNTSPGRATVVVHASNGVVVRQNIFAGETHGYGLQFFQCSGVHACNIYWENANGAIDPPALGDDELVADPLFCAPNQGVYALYDISPAAPGNSPCGQLIGAFPVECTSTATLATSWGELKNLY